LPGSSGHLGVFAGGQLQEYGQSVGGGIDGQSLLPMSLQYAMMYLGR
jgi:hypothetical protein